LPGLNGGGVAATVPTGTTGTSNAVKFFLMHYCEGEYSTEVNSPSHRRTALH